MNSSSKFVSNRRSLHNSDKNFKVWGKTVPPCQNRPALYNGAVNMISRYYRYILVNATVNSFGFFS